MIISKPLPINQDSFSTPSPSNYTFERYPSFLLRQASTLRPEYSQKKGIPYDHHCPSVKN